MFRLATIHPLLAHFTIGGLPFVLLGYGLGLKRRSPAWIFVGDVGLFVTALAALGATAFGLVSNAVVPWPGGIELWRWLHLGLGVLATLLLAVLALVRWAALRRQRPAAAGLLTGALAAAVVVGAAGWVGGEVLVYHAGMAVRAAGEGAFSPPVRLLAPDGPPRDLLDAMGQVRAEWAEITVRAGGLLVQHPRDPAAEFEAIAARARRLHELSAWMADHPPADVAQPVVFLSMSLALHGGAQEIEEAARKRDLPAVVRALGEASATCAECHRGLRTRR